MVSEWNKRPLKQKDPFICSAHFRPESVICSFGRTDLVDGVVPVFINSDKMFNPSLNNFRNNDEEEPLENLVYDYDGGLADYDQPSPSIIGNVIDPAEIYDVAQETQSARQIKLVFSLFSLIFRYLVFLSI